MSKPITLPILEAFDYLHNRNLTIDKMWTKREPGCKPTTHVTVKPRPPKLKR
jgi:hypothetical protein